MAAFVDDDLAAGAGVPPEAMLLWAEEAVAGELDCDALLRASHTHAQTKQQQQQQQQRDAAVDDVVSLALSLVLEQNQKQQMLQHPLHHGDTLPWLCAEQQHHQHHQQPSPLLTPPSCADRDDSGADFLDVGANDEHISGLLEMLSMPAMCLQVSMTDNNSIGCNDSASAASSFDDSALSHSPREMTVPRGPDANENEIEIEQDNCSQSETTSNSTSASPELFTMEDVLAADFDLAVAMNMSMPSMSMVTPVSPVSLDSCASSDAGSCSPINLLGYAGSLASSTSCGGSPFLDNNDSGLGEFCGNFDPQLLENLMMSSEAFSAACAAATVPQRTTVGFVDVHAAGSSNSNSNSNSSSGNSGTRRSTTTNTKGHSRNSSASSSSDSIDSGRVGKQSNNTTATATTTAKAKQQKIASYTKAKPAGSTGKRGRPSKASGVATNDDEEDETEDTAVTAPTAAGDEDNCAIHDDDNDDQECEQNRAVMNSNPANFPPVESFLARPLAAHDAVRAAVENRNTTTEMDLHLLSVTDPQLLRRAGLGLTKLEERELKHLRRRLKNKLAAAESRRRKKNYIQGLEKRVEDVTSENTRLQHRLQALEAELAALRIENSQLRLQQQHYNHSHHEHQLVHKTSARAYVDSTGEMLIASSKRQKLLHATEKPDAAGESLVAMYAKGAGGGFNGSNQTSSSSSLSAALKSRTGYLMLFALTFGLMHSWMGTDLYQLIRLDSNANAAAPAQGEPAATNTGSKAAFDFTKSPVLTKLLSPMRSASGATSSSSNSHISRRILFADPGADADLAFDLSAAPCDDSFSQMSSVPLPLFDDDEPCHLDLGGNVTFFCDGRQMTPEAEVFAGL